MQCSTKNSIFPLKITPQNIHLLTQQTTRTCILNTDLRWEANFMLEIFPASAGIKSLISIKSNAPVNHNT